MINSFNAWSEPWITIEKTDGKALRAGIFDTLKDSHNIRAIRAATPTETFGILRLLITVITDIYRPEIWKDIEKIRSGGKFNYVELEDYYNNCLKEGASFDLFDQKRPFLQYAFKDIKKEDAKPSANLFDQLPTGNNVPHFVHKSQYSYAFTPQRCLQALCAIPFYEKHKRGKKVTTGINGIPPIYFLYNGDTLFETLTSSLICKAQYAENNYGKPIWRDLDCFNMPKSATPDLLHGLFSSPLKIKLIPSDDDLIREIYFEQGIDYKDTIWTDPHVAYSFNIKKDKKKDTLKAKNNRAVWRDLPVIINPDAIKILFNWRNRKINNCLTAYVKLCELKGTVFMAVTQFMEELKIPFELLDNEFKRDCYCKAVSVSDRIANDCAYALKSKIKGVKNNTNPYAAILPDIFKEVFLSEFKEIVDSSLIKLLDKADTDTYDWEIRINEFLSKRFRNALTIALNSALNTVSDENADTLILKTKLRNKVYKKSNYLLKTGGYTHDKANN